MKGGCREDGALPSGAQCQDRRPWAQTVAQEAPSEHQEQCCAEWVPEHWHRLPRGCGVSSLQLSRSRLAVGLGTLLWVVLLEQGLGHRHTESPACLSQTGVLGFL